MTDLLIKQPQGFAWGYTPITQIGEQSHDTGMNFGILRLKAGEQKDLTNNLETACLLMSGEVTFSYNQEVRDEKRQSLFDEDPIALHCAAGQSIKLIAKTDCELALVQTENSTNFESMLFNSSNMLESEQRGKDLLEDTASRNVRTIFDIRNRPEAKLVLGEVINFPGRWSSYPPHHHLQPEIYHYRFTELQGYGHGEVGDAVVRVHQGDTLKILYENDHAQTAAPGYGMYYIWAIRHLPNLPYTVPEFTPEHSWTKTSEANQRAWKATA